MEDKKKLPVRFPKATRDFIYSLVEELELSPSIVSRTAMILGVIKLKQMKEVEIYPGHTSEFVNSFGTMGENKE